MNTAIVARKKNSLVTLTGPDTEPRSVATLSEIGLQITKRTSNALFL